MASFNRVILNNKILRNNIKTIRANIGNTQFCLVLKANAYGLGADRVLNAIGDQADLFAVANVKEAKSVRKIEKNKKIIILGIVDKRDLLWCQNNNVSVSVPSVEILEYYLSNKHINNLNVQIQINSGMNRFGINNAKDLTNIAKIIKKCRKINCEGVYSHIASQKNANAQLAVFNALVNGANFAGKKHISASLMAINPRFGLDCVRVGFAVFGGGKYTQCPIEIKAKIIHINHIKKGESVGYENTFVAQKEMKIGVVSLGYADGFSRNLSNNFSVLVNGEWAKVVGLVCMDVFMVDLTNINAKLFDDVTILGKSGNKKLTLKDYAVTLNTSEYEILTNFGKVRK